MSGPELPLERTKDTGAGPGEKQAMNALESEQVVMSRSILWG